MPSDLKIVRSCAGERRCCLATTLDSGFHSLPRRGHVAQKLDEFARKLARLRHAVGHDLAGSRQHIGGQLRAAGHDRADRIDVRPLATAWPR